MLQFMANLFQSSSKQGMEVVEDQQGAQGAVEGDAEYAVVQGVFATGFSVPGRTTPGFTIRSAVLSRVSGRLFAAGVTRLT